MSRFNKTLVATAVAAAFLAAAPVQAAIENDGIPGLGNKQFDPPGSGGIGELFVSIVARDAGNPGNNNSYVRDLGITSGTFVDALRSNALGTLNFSFAADSLLQSFLSDNAGLNISFNVTAVHNKEGYDPNNFFTIDTGMLTTSGQSAGATAAAGPQNLAGYATAENNVAVFINGVNLATDGSATGNPALNLSVLRTPGQGGYHDNNFGGSSTFGFNTEGGIGSPVDFYFLSADNDNSYLELLGNWELQNSGALVFNPAGAAPVPVPAAAWLFGSALACVTGLRRRRDA